MQQTQVEFRCMVQDILGNEMYFKDADKKQLGDRTTFYCITIPGENEWVRSNPKGSKNDFMTNGQDHVGNRDSNSSGSSTTTTTTTPAVAAHSTIPNNITSNDVNNSNSAANDAASNDEQERTDRLSFTLVNWSYPIAADGKNRSCLIRVYDINLAEYLRVNDIIHVTGHVDYEDEDVDHESQAQGDNDTNNVAGGDPFRELVNGHQEFEPASDFPHRLVPRVHVKTLKKLSHINPLLPEIISRDQLDITSLKLTRARLSTILTQLLGGDSFSAEYLILSLISKIIRRKDVTTLGQFTVGLSGIKPEMKFLIEKLYHIISKITTHSHFLDMSLANLNNLRFTPKKDYDNNKMIAGTLQLPDGLYLMLNETALSQGQLTTQGTENLSTLVQIIRWQKHNYDFKFQTVEIDTDLKILVVSEGKSILSVPYQVRIEKNDPETINSMRQACESVDDFLTEELLNRFRYFITALKDVPEYSIPDDVQKRIQGDFIKWRKEDESNGKVLFSADDLSSYMTLARYLTISRGESELTNELWNETCRMESTRQLRLFSN